MNCEKCQDLVSDLLDGSLSHHDQATLSTHLDECLTCAGVRNDLQSIISFCQANRGQYTAPPNERALWLRIRNVIESGTAAATTTAAATAAATKKSWGGWLGRSWELSLGQMIAFAAAIIVVVSLSTVVGLRRYQNGTVNSATNSPQNLQAAAEDVRARVSQQQQLISYWNQRVEFNKSRWSPEMRETFDRNLKVIDQAVSDSMNSLTQNPHDEVSEEMLNAALNEKLSLLKEFAEL